MQIEAGQYCTFSVSSDGSVRACGKGSYGRLGLGDSNNQSVPKKLVLDPPRCMRKVSSSKGSDGHTLAVTVEGEVFSWGDGDYGKLGHGNSATQKYPKIIQGPLLGKVRRKQAWNYPRLLIKVFAPPFINTERSGLVSEQICVLFV